MVRVLEGRRQHAHCQAQILHIKGLATMRLAHKPIYDVSKPIDWDM
jgi:hypothetical protein